MEFKKFFDTESGRTIISILLGLGLATLFRKNCEGKNCFNFIAPKIDDIKTKIYKYGNNCFKYTLESISCDINKQNVNYA